MRIHLDWLCQNTCFMIYFLTLPWHFIRISTQKHSWLTISLMFFKLKHKVDYISTSVNTKYVVQSRFGCYSVFCSSGKPIVRRDFWLSPSCSFSRQERFQGLDPTAEEKEEFTKKMSEKFTRETSALYSASRGWDDGIILPRETRKVGQYFVVLYVYVHSSPSQLYPSY